jgi:hypothetical protein
MADTNEEQLLTELLGRIAREDARLDAVHLEARVIEAKSGGATVRLAVFAKATAPKKADPTYAYVGIAAAVVIAVMVPDFGRMTRNVPANTTAVTVESAREVPETQVAIAKPIISTRPASAPPALRRGKPTQPANPTRPTLADEFVPLMPMTEQDLAGPFQLVRVQMPNASLGPLRSPRQHPGELIEADVLLGEDGLARAIRVSTSGSVYPWRSR